MKSNMRPNKTKFAKKNQTTVLKPSHAHKLDYVISILLIAFSVITIVALATYSPNDSCWSRTFDTDVIHNQLGTFGAYFSDLLFYLFGYSTWLIPCGIFYLAVFKMLRREIKPGNLFSVARVVAYLFLLISVSGFEYLLFANDESVLPDGFGGAVGEFFDLQLHEYMTEAVMAIILLVIIAITMSFVFKIKWLFIVEKIGLYIEKFYLWLSNLIGRRDAIDIHQEELHEELVTQIAEEEPALINRMRPNLVSRVVEEPNVVEYDSLDEYAVDDNEANINFKEVVENGIDEIDNDYVELPDFSTFDNIEDEMIVEKEELVEEEAIFDFSNLESINDSNFAEDDEEKSFDEPAEYYNNIEDTCEEIVEEEITDSQNQLNSMFQAFEKQGSIIQPIQEVLPEVQHNTPQSNYFSNYHHNNDDAQLPPTELLSMPVPTGELMTPEQQAEVADMIESTYKDFGIAIEICNVETGPVITRYELIPPRGVKGEKIVGFAKEVARALAMPSVRIVENIVGKNTMGIEVPNVKRQTIYLREIFDSEQFAHNSSKLTLALGKDISGNVIVTDLAKMPHLLVAGTTGSGKSVSVNAMILSILYKAKADEVKFIMIDPKMVELSFYQDIPHLLAPVVTDMSQAANALKWTVGEMERRYKIMAKVGTKKIIDFNNKVVHEKNKGKPLYNPLITDSKEELEKWPFIVVIIDELADLMMTEGKKIEQYIARIAQKARAVGIHLIIATQRPSADVITGLIKTNVPARIAFQIPTAIDSRIILGQPGAEALLGQGDMLFAAPGGGLRRIHGAFVNDDELHEIVEFLKSQGTPDYDDEILSGDIDVIIPGVENDSNDNGVESDPIFDQAVKFMMDTKRCSISSLQTQFGIGYNKGARIMMHLEKIGMVRRTEKGTYELLRHSIE